MCSLPRYQTIYDGLCVLEIVAFALDSRSSDHSVATQQLRRISQPVDIMVRFLLSYLHDHCHSRPSQNLYSLLSQIPPL